MINVHKISLDIVERLKPMHPEKIFLFGSYAYGKPTEDSDLDICVVERNISSKIDEKRKIRLLLKDIRIAKDILVSDLEEYDFYKHEINSVYNEIDTKGILLWQRS